MADATRLPVPPAVLAELRALHLRKTHLVEVLQLVQDLALEFDRRVVAFAADHGVEAQRIERLDLDGAALVLAADDPGEASPAAE